MTESSSSAFTSPEQFSASWSDISLQKQHTHTRVYTATRYGRRFVLKALPEQDAKLTEYRLHQEKEFMLGVQLVHPNIAATYSLEEVPGLGRCIVQEYIDGMTLSEWLKTKPAISARKRVMEQLLEALEYIHSLQLVHHDLKADNILITRNGANVKLIDFGLSETDDTRSSVKNDVRTDIRAIGKLMPKLLPHRHTLIACRCRIGNYPNIAAIRQSLRRKKFFVRAIPYLLLSLAVSVAIYLGIAHEEETGVDANEIEQVLTDFYQPFVDSLEAGYWYYKETASIHFILCYNHMGKYEQLSTRYPIGSVQYSTFSNTWLAVFNKINKYIYDKINALPSISAAKREGNVIPEGLAQWEEEHRRLQMK